MIKIVSPRLHNVDMFFDHTFKHILLYYSRQIDKKKVLKSLYLLDLEVMVKNRLRILT